MSQTLQAFVAVMMVATFTMNFQTARLINNKAAIEAELEIMANAVGSEMLNYFGSMPYDGSINGTIDRSALSVGSLTGHSDFGDDTDDEQPMTFDTGDDLDDFHNMQPVVVMYNLSDGQSIEFTVNALVEYVDDTGAASASPTWTKQVTLRITGPSAANGRPLMSSDVIMTRQFSPHWS